MDDYSLPRRSLDSISPLSSQALLNDYFRLTASPVMPYSRPQFAESLRRMWNVLVSFKTRRHIKKWLRWSLLGVLVLITVFLLGVRLQVVSIDPSVLPLFGSTSERKTTAAVIPPENNAEKMRITAERAKFQAQFDMTKKLAAHPSPLDLLRYCSNPRHKLSSANYLVSAVADEGTITRMDFGWHPARAPRYNPNILPFPKDYKHPYIGFARQSPKGVLYHHEIVWCEMDWGETPAIGRKVLVCAQPAQRLTLPEWVSKPGSCKSLPYLALKAGHSDPRVLFSPRGEPLMVVGNNGKSNCMGQFVIDLRVVVPGLNWKMGLRHVPIRYKTLTELPRPEYNEVEKNWFLMWDEADVGYVQHETERRSVSLLNAPQNKQVNIATPGIQKCLSVLKRPIKDRKSQANDIHQATNSLRVTLCDFPCIPTIHNTVIIELMHMKYKNVYELFYRRYVIIMNATAPFNVIGRTGNLMYAGTDERTMLYSVSMTWDHEHYSGHEEWDEDVHGGHQYLQELEAEKEREAALRKSPDEDTNTVSASKEEQKETREGLISQNYKNGAKKMKRYLTESMDSGRKLFKRAKPADDKDGAGAPSATLLSATSSMTTTVLTTSAKASTSQPGKTDHQPQNPLVNKYYHGWLDDTIMINIGINDNDAGVLHVRARDLLECIHTCE
ncbi:hypothetical protein V1517DRAFT_265407 [Lipomyces orientalis]|uniref:Uncharacterized protein n=1 Tax=Lipomyces orientalis TaxID=1233043 RepID=A0ACC3TFJ4_9ASCO